MFDLKRLFAPSSLHAGPAAGFQRMLEWRLLRGSHYFPGPDGGTCVNEAAIVAAGHPYRAVRSIEDCPASFSRAAATYAVFLNDLIENDAVGRRGALAFVRG